MSITGTAIVIILIVIIGLIGCGTPEITPSSTDSASSPSEPSTPPVPPPTTEETTEDLETPSTTVPETPADSSTVIEGTLADDVLQKDVLDMIMIFEKFYGHACTTQKVTGKVITEIKSAEGTWAEKWTLDRCGESVAYDIGFWPDKEGEHFLKCHLLKHHKPSIPDHVGYV
jgi:hypothetical protein